MSLPAWAIILAGTWAIVNGLLHDIFVLRSEHGKVYNRNLLRLLMDGHILITCGAVQLLAFSGIDKHEPWAYYIAVIATISLLAYCAMIWSFLKSVGTITINAVALGILVWGYFQV